MTDAQGDNLKDNPPDARTHSLLEKLERSLVVRAGRHGSDRMSTSDEEQGLR